MLSHDGKRNYKSGVGVAQGLADPGPLDSAYVLWDGINVESGLPSVIPVESTRLKSIVFKDIWR